MGYYHRSRFIEFFWNSFLLLGLVSVLVPLEPLMPGGSFDDSWQLALNQALAQGLVFGKDLIFTFGPLASVYTKTYHPFTDGSMVVASSILALSFWWVLTKLLSESSFAVRGFWWIFMVGFWGMGVSRFAFYPVLQDAVFFSYPIFVGVYYLKTFYENSSDKRKIPSWVESVFLFLPFGMLPLIKVSNLAISIAVMGLLAGVFLLERQPKLLFVSLFIPLASLIVISYSLHQPLNEIPEFIRTSLSISGSYSSQMATDFGVNSHPTLFLVSAAIFLVFLFRETSWTLKGRLFLCTLMVCYLFLCFKAGFTRSDERHVPIAGQALVLSAMILSLISISPRAKDIVFLTSLLGLVIWGEYQSVHLVKNIHTNLAAFKNGVRLRLRSKRVLNQEFERVLQRIKKTDKLPLLDGSTDIFSSGQLSLIASGNQWSPRPVFQSYATLNSFLAEKNQAFLLGDAAPQNILFRIEPIDGRLASVEDAASWPVLLDRYENLGIENGYLKLRKKEDAKFKGQILERKNAALKTEEVISVPRTQKPLFARLEGSLTSRGQIANIFYKPQSLAIKLKCEDGSEKEFRLPHEMAKQGFLVSPLVESTEDFQALFAQDETHSKKVVTALSVKPSGMGNSWNDSFKVVFYNY